MALSIFILFSSLIFPYLFDYNQNLQLLNLEKTFDSEDEKQINVHGNRLVYKQHYFVKKEYMPWNYVIPIEIHENSGINLIDFPVKITVNLEDLIARGRLKSDASDLFFISSSGILPYWIEYGKFNNESNVWVKIPFIKSNSISNIYMLYDNPSFVSTSNASLVFDYYDGFED